MTEYIVVFAYLNTVPEGKNFTRKAGSMAHINYPKVTRNDLLDVLFTIGPANFFRDSITPIPTTEIKAYSDAVLSLNSWEVETIKILSNLFVNQSNLARNPDAPPPWIKPEDKPAPKANDIRNAIGKAAKIKRVKRNGN